MLFCTSLVALVGAAENQPSNSPRKLQIVNTKVSLEIVHLALENGKIKADHRSGNRQYAS